MEQVIKKRHYLFLYLRAALCGTQLGPLSSTPPNISVAILWLSSSLSSFRLLLYVKIAKCIQVACRREDGSILYLQPRILQTLFFRCTRFLRASRCSPAISLVENTKSSVLRFSASVRITYASIKFRDEMLFKLVLIRRLRFRNVK